MRSILAESKNYLVYNEYEVVFLLFKKANKRICIGDFYGDPEAAVISNNERFCVVVGCGLIIYYLQEPFEEFRYKTSTRQWKELFRDNGKEWWIEEVEVVNDSIVMFTVGKDTDYGGRYKINVNNTELTKCI